MIKFLIYGYMLMLLSLTSLLMWLYLSMNKYQMIFEWLIFKFNSMKFNMFLMMDDISMIFFMIILFISSMIMFYSIEYMNLPKIIQYRYFYLLILFIMSMILMISSPSILTILLGWDGLGLISYCLIIFYQNSKSSNSGMMTIIINRIGDVSLLMLISMMISNESFNLMLYYSNNLISIMLIIMMMTKSAQMPFSSWLPAAMSAPTPISSLVHSSTLVTAGIYILIRYINLMNNSYLLYLLFISSITYLMASFIANFEFDIKKLIALSTLSQLGLMMSILTLKMNNLAFLHLIIHAMFKSLMFMCAGSLIHYLNNNQDLRNYTNIFYLYPLKSLIFMFSSMCLCGFPFLGAFYSKDLIIEFFFLSKLNFLCLMNLFWGTIFSLSYSIRLMMIMLNKNYPKFKLIYFKENYFMIFSMMMMMMLTILFSKFYLNMKFMLLNYNLSMFLKTMIIQMMLMSTFMGFFYFKFNNSTYFNKSKNLYKNMMYLNSTYKSIYLYFLEKMLPYEIYFEKTIFFTYSMNYKIFNNLIINFKVFKIFKNLSLYYHLMLMIFII